MNDAILNNETFQNSINNTIPVSQINIDDYDAVYYTGGFGLLSDLATNEHFAKLSAKHYEDGGILSTVCHGPAGVLPIVLSNGEKLLASKSVTGFTRSAARFNKVQPWGAFVIEGDRVITGQNPTSAHAVGEAVVKQLAK